MRLSSGCDVPHLVWGAVSEHGVEDVDAAAGEGEDYGYDAFLADVDALVAAIKKAKSIFDV